jgi:hypothetical protein
MNHLAHFEVGTEGSLLGCKAVRCESDHSSLPSGEIWIAKYLTLDVFMATLPLP